jgi:hypothetical protein
MHVGELEWAGGAVTDPGRCRLKVEQMCHAKLLVALEFV